MEKEELRTIYHRTERLTVVVLLLALPAFGLVYLQLGLNTSSLELVFFFWSYSTDCFIKK
jgi:hypothetical protein